MRVGNDCDCQLMAHIKRHFSLSSSASNMSPDPYL